MESARQYEVLRLYNRYLGVIILTSLSMLVARHTVCLSPVRIANNSVPNASVLRHTRLQRPTIDSSVESVPTSSSN